MKVHQPMEDPDVVRTSEEARALEQEPLVVLEPLRAFLDAAGLGSGPLRAHAIGGGHSNVTYAIVRGERRFVLRRPPRGPLMASAHDVIREAGLLRALAPSAVPLPEVLAICDRPDVIGAPFYVMPFIDGRVLECISPPEFAQHEHEVGEQLVDTLAELHAVDATVEALSSFGRPSGYLPRQVARFTQLLSQNATRPLPELEKVATWLSGNLPASPATTVVHGDYRLGNSMFAMGTRPQIVALLDWEMATLGDPLADVGYMTAMWADPDDEPDPMLKLSEITRGPRFLRRAQLADRYAQRTGRDLSALDWYQVLAVWKAAIFLEGSYQRYLAGTTSDSYFAHLGEGVLKLARRALQQTQALS